MGLVVIGVLEQLGTAPGVAEVVLRPRADGGRELLPIHEELLVAFPPPAAPRIPHVQHHAGKAPRALGLHERPVNPALGLPRQEGVAVPLGMETTQLGDGLRQRRMHYLEAHVAWRFAIVDQLHASLLIEGHVPIAVPPPILTQAQRQ